MKELTLKFRTIFHRYDYENCNLDILMELLDVVLEMAKIVDLDDSDNIKRLASFIKVLSSDFCKDIITSNMIDEIYVEQVIPIFVEFDNKYDTKKCEVEDLPEHRAISFVQKAKEAAKKVIKKVFHKNDNVENNNSVDDALIYYTADNYESPDNINIDQDKTLFGMLKRTGDKMVNLYNNIIQNKGDDNQILRELRDIQVSASVSSVHCNQQINLLSMALDKVSNFLIDALSRKDYKMIYDNERGLEESFEFMNKLHYPD